ncbi:MAG: glycoside hydrolase family 3 protein [Clostridia bacterium]|nr:glycoside hydrolase family 3 protein [Clostridia bacterium]
MISVSGLPLQKAEEILNTLSLEEKIGQMCIASIEVTEMDERTRVFLTENAIGNVILFGKNCRDRAQIARLNGQLQDVITARTGLQALISIDQEGGRVTRIRRGATVFPSAMSIGSTGDPENAYLTGRIMGNEMRALGICHDLAPVYDCNFEEDEPFCGNRSYAAKPEDVARFATAMSRGLRDAGVMDCAKHFPGAGRNHGDTHFEFVVQTETAEGILNGTLIPFKAGMADGLCSVMSSHTCNPSLEPDVIPNTISKRILRDLCRDQLGFKGIIVSDDILMNAIKVTYGAENGAVLAAEAGCDMVIIGNGGDNANPDGLDVQPPIVRRMIEAARSGELSMSRINESVRLIIAFKLALGDMRPAADVTERDWSAHEAFSAALTASAVKLARDTDHLLPLPEGALFLSRRSHARLGVEEGDILFDSFGPYAADALKGTAVEFDAQPDLSALESMIRTAPAVVFSVVNEKECLELLPALKAVYEMNPRLCFVCLDSPHILKHVPFAPCAVYSYDQTLHAVRAVCGLLG